MMHSFGWCTAGTLSDNLQKKCDNQELSLTDMTLEVMAAYPSVPFAFIQSKTDEVQRSFYFAIAITGNNDVIYNNYYHHNRNSDNIQLNDSK
jgi:hypothetical protein